MPLEQLLEAREDGVNVDRLWKVLHVQPLDVDGSLSLRDDGEERRLDLGRELDDETPGVRDDANSVGPGRGGLFADSRKVSPPYASCKVKLTSTPGRRSFH